MSNIFDLKGSQDKESTVLAPFEPTPTMHLPSRTHILEEEERHQRITRVAEEDQQQQLTIDKNKPTEGTYILQVTQPHNVYKQDNETMPIPPPMVPRTTIMMTRSIPGGDSGFQQVMSRLGPCLTDNWQWNAVADRRKQGPVKEKAKMLQPFGAFLIMRPQLGYLTCIHFAHVYHPLVGSPSECDGEVAAFIGDRTATRMPTPVKLPPRSSFEFPQLKVVDDPRLIKDAYEESGLLGHCDNPWAPSLNNLRRSNECSCSQILASKILHAMGG
jgi:hypothetical protein